MVERALLPSLLDLDPDMELLVLHRFAEPYLDLDLEPWPLSRHNIGVGVGATDYGSGYSNAGYATADSDLLMRQKSTQYAFVSPATNLLPPTLWDNRGPFPFPYPF